MIIDPTSLAPKINCLGTALQPCSFDPLTGFLRDGCCNTCAEDVGSHTVCVEISDAFLHFSSARGNDLTTPHPEFSFKGLKPGDQWCLCAARWLEAYKAGIAPKVILTSTHEGALEIIPLELLEQHAVVIN